jgi:hypothetical protein
VRVGSPKLDNYHRVRGDRAIFTSGSAVVIEDTPLALKRRLWLDTDRTYRLAAERDIQLRRLNYRRDTLEDIFLKAMETNTNGSL